MITKDQIKLSDGHAGVTASGSPVIYILSKGGLHMFLTKNGEQVEALAAAPHIGIARFFAEKKAGGINWAPDYIMKSDLEKGSRQRAMGNPKQHVTSDEGDSVFDWTEGESGRNDIPEAHPEAKARIFQKLHSQTEVRKHPKTGERMFLLHRGVAGDLNNRIPHEFNHTSWTPSHGTAQSFSEKDEGIGKKGFVRSAWIPESAIHNYTNNAIGTKQYKQRGGTGDFQHEQEYIVKPLKGHNYLEAKQQPLPTKNVVNNKINARSGVEEEVSNPVARTKIMQDITRKSENNFLEIRKSFFNKEIMASEETYAIYNHKEKLIDIMDREEFESTLKKGDITPFSFVRRIDIESVPKLIGT